MFPSQHVTWDPLWEDSFSGSILPPVPATFSLNGFTTYNKEISSLTSRRTHEFEEQTGSGFYLICVDMQRTVSLGKLGFLLASSSM